MERQTREAKLTAQEREVLRQRECAALRASVEVGAALALPKSVMGRGGSCALKQWERLECYAGAGHVMVEFDNDWAEHATTNLKVGSTLTSSSAFWCIAYR